jgi:thioester reductase-like protein
MDRVLVTGATGFVGAHLVDHLLQSSDYEIHCLARSRPGHSAASRIFNRLDEIAVTAANGNIGAMQRMARDRVRVIEGDVRQPSLGMAPSAVSANFCEVWHVAGLTDFLLSQRDRVFDANVVGGRNVLAFMAANAIPICNYVSTAFVAGTKSGEIEEAPHDAGFPSNNPYEESKREMEEEILRAASSGRFDYRIFRPSVIVGHSRTGKPDPTSRGLYGFLALALSLKREIEKSRPRYFVEHKLRVLADRDQNLNLVTVDQVVSQMAEIASEQRSINNIFHIAPRDGFRADGYLDVLSDVLDLDVEFTTAKDQFTSIDYMFQRQTARYRCYLHDSKSFNLQRTDSFVRSSQEYTITRDVLRRLLVKFREQWEMPGASAALRVRLP